MPQASDQLQAQMIERFGSIDDVGPSKFLTDAGYTLNVGWTWTPKSGVSKVEDMTRPEFDCLLFLVHEWDYGGLTTAR